MAEVLLGRTTGEGGFEKLVAIKRILPSMTDNESFVKMFIDEARISAKLNHSSIGQIFEFGKAGQSYFIAMEHIQGVDLREIYRYYRKVKSQPLPPMAAFIITAVCAALEYAHSRADDQGRPLNIIHRDLSPSNVLISFTGEVKLIDFGIAKAAERLYVTVGPNLKGKYAYMSPEQASGKEVDRRSDIFGLGTLLFELLTGRNPFRANTELETLQRVQAARVPPPSAVVKGVPKELDAVCLRALSQSPDDRYSSAGEMQQELEAYTRRTGFSSRRMSTFMAEAFSHKREETQAMLRKAREEARSQPPRDPSVDDDLSELFGQAAAPEATVNPVGPTVVPDARGPGSQPSSPGGQAPSPGSQPSAPGIPATGAPPPREDASVSFVTSPADPALGELHHPMRRRSNTTFHVILFSIITCAMGVGVYFIFGDAISRIRKPVVKPGQVKLVVSNPSPAQVLVDNTPHGALGEDGLYVVEGLLPGKHRVLLKGPGLRPVENVIEVKAGEITELSLFLEHAALDGGLPEAGGKKKKKSNKNK